MVDQSPHRDSPEAMPLEGPSTPQPSPPGAFMDEDVVRIKPPALRIQEVCRENPALLQIDCPSEDLLARQRCIKGVEPFLWNPDRTPRNVLSQMHIILRGLARQSSASDSMVFWELWDHVFVLLVETELATVDKLMSLHKGRLFVPQGKALEILNRERASTAASFQPPPQKQVGTSSMRRILREEEAISPTGTRGPKPSLW